MKYKRLSQADIIKKNDEYYQWGRWWKIEIEFIGKQKGEIFSHYVRMRRLVK
jgi:hypothetical protein